MNGSVVARWTLGAVACCGIAGTLLSDGNARGAAALAAHFARSGDRESATRWLERSRVGARSFERALEFDVRDDWARAWWRQRGRFDFDFEKPLRPGR